MKAHDMALLEADIQYSFRSPELLRQALTHSSHAREQESQQSEGKTGIANGDNEQLEFMGDAILGFITSEALLTRFPEFREGQLSKLRAHLVSEKHLIRAAKQLHLGRYLRLGKGEEKSGGRSKTALQVDALEALLAAMYLDSGIERVREFVLQVILEPELKRLKRQTKDGFPITDYKSALQEKAHRMSRSQPTYVLVKEAGPEHNKIFTVEACIHGHGEVEYVGRGQGPTKKKAEQDAAKDARGYLSSIDERKTPKGRKKGSSGAGE